MRTALQVEISFDQVLELVKQLPIKDKIKLTRELEKEGIETKLEVLLRSFKTDELSVESINEEVENVRQKMYDDSKH